LLIAALELKAEAVIRASVRAELSRFMRSEVNNVVN
jgi:hypothetical protein